MKGKILVYKSYSEEVTSDFGPYIIMIYLYNDSAIIVYNYYNVLVVSYDKTTNTLTVSPSFEEDRPLTNCKDEYMSESSLATMSSQRYYP